MKFPAVGTAARGGLKRLSEALELLKTQKAFTLTFSIFPDISAGIDTIGTKSPHFREVEHFREHAKRTIGLVGNVGIGMMQLGNVGARHLDPPLSQDRKGPLSRRK
jgi:hypothetical protein